MTGEVPVCPVLSSSSYGVTTRRNRYCNRRGLIARISAACHEKGPRKVGLPRLLGRSLLGEGLPVINLERKPIYPLPDCLPS